MNTTKKTETTIKDNEGPKNKKAGVLHVWPCFGSNPCREMLCTNHLGFSTKYVI